ncbi:MAG: translation initiation factor IF-6 [Desulfurococcales archaeon ex4484_217_1]|nr:MAG: translation initiation factor IF-6 [Desulfurococcales archaeon ex4484_217_1]
MPSYRVSFNGNIYIGAFIFTNDKLTFTPPNTPNKLLNAIGEVLKTEILQVKIMDSPIIGILMAGNNKGIILPYLVKDEELEAIRRNLKNVLNIGVLPSKKTAVGNIILANDKAALVHPELDRKTIKFIEDILDVPVEQGTIAGIPTVGSVAVATNKGMLVHPEASAEELKFLEDLFKVRADVGTVNFGVSFIKTGIVVNSFGALVGERTTGPEIMRIEQIFDIAGE